MTQRGSSIASCRCRDGDRLEALVKELEGERDRAIVFVRTKRGADRLVKRLDARGVKAVAIHGDKSQGQRNRALSHFQSGHVDTLVATDLAAEESTSTGVSHVVNFDPPADNTPTSTESGARDAPAVAAWG